MKNIKKIILFIFLIFFTSKAYSQNNNSLKSFFDGPYAGLALGSTKFRTTFKDPKITDDWYARDSSGFIYPLRFGDSEITGTASAGYNWTISKIYLLGLETEVSNGNNQQWKSDYSDRRVTANTELVFNLRLKFGAIQDKNLYYASVGPAMADVKYNAIWNGEYPISISKRVYGFNYGVGIERQINENGSIKFEYMITDLNNASKPYPFYDGEVCYYSSCIGPSWETKIFSIRLGYNYHF